MNMRKIKHTILRLPHSGEVILYLNHGGLSLESGTGDDITVRTIGNNLVVLSVNKGIPTVGLSVYNRDTLETVDDSGGLYFQGEFVYRELPMFDTIEYTSILRRLYRLYCEVYY